MDLQKYLVKSVCKDESKGIQTVELDNGLKLELKQYWYDSLIEVGDSVAVGIDKQQEEEETTITIETAQNFIVLNPDHLVTSTELSNAGFCHRKTWLNSRFQFYGESNYAALLGTLVHCLFQETISDKKLTKQHLDATLLRLIKQPFVLRTLLVLNKNEDDLIKDSREYIASIIRFNRKFNAADGSGGQPPVEFDKGQPNLKIRINKVTDIEDTIVAPNYGLKGKIDATMNVKLYDTHDKNQTKFKTQLTPFELKTGKVSFSYAHQAQVSLYTLMIDNSTNKCDFGLLAYLKGDINMKYVTMTNFVRNDLLMQRNELVHYYKYLENGPRTRSNTSFCSKCEHLLDCCLLGKLYEPEKIASFETYQPDLVLNTLSHLDEKQIIFFKRWIDMIYLEERKVKDSRDSLFWNQNAIDLEANGKAIAKLVLHTIKDSSYEYTFRRSDNYRNLGPLPVDIQFYKNVNRMTLSVENEDGKFEKISFVNGVITSIDDNFLTVQLDEHIKEDYFNKLFRLDILPIQPNFTYLYTSLLCLMDKEANSKFLRELIIENRKPAFEPLESGTLDSLVVRDIVKDLNNCQQKAVRRSLEAKDYLLINGYPGSGKTETIVHLIKILVKMNKTVVITAHTNQAVDHILVKLVKHGINFMRIGNLSRIDPDLISYSEDYQLSNCTSTYQMKQIYSSTSIFAGTCYSMCSHMIFKMRLINYTIVDEASQLNLPENLLPLFNTEKFILVGDPNQLTPIVNSKRAQLAGFGQTLFEILMQTEDNSVELTIQYRMNKEIMRIANICTYDNKLTCGSDKIANATLNMGDRCQFEMEEIDLQLNNNCWMDRCCSSHIGLSVLFLNTDEHHYSSDELEDGDGKVCNLFEVNILKQIVDQLLEGKVLESEIGIISFYQRQVKLLKSSFSTNPEIEISTIDQYQGRDKNIILISCVKVQSNPSDDMETNSILNDNRRLNVAITRAKNKLILIGSLAALNNYKPFIKLFSFFKEHQIINV